MDHEPYDSSGTDDDLPPSHQSRMPRGNGRPTITSMPYPIVYGEADMETQIHKLEQEAYSSVLRAFQAQADAITWEKEGLITELRKELRVSNEEHRELLNRVNADDVIRRIREWRETSVLPSVSVSHQPSLSAKIGPLSGSKSKKRKLGTSSVKSIPFTAADTSGRSQVANRVPHAIPKGATTELIGKKIRTKWPDDNNFYEAVILDYNALEGRHALVYDIGTANETWEWVDLTEISPEDIQWVGDDLLSPQNVTGNKNPYDIQILHTDTLIKEVERVFGASHPDPLEVEKAKKLLKDHEQALLDAISRLANFPDGESDKGGRRYRQALERL